MEVGMMNRRLAFTAGLFVATMLAVPDTHTQERFIGTAAATTAPVTIADPLRDIPTQQVYVPGDCSTLFVMAMEAGWTWNEWPKLAWIMGSRNGNGESGCIATATNLKGRDKSYGLLQINTRGRLWDKAIAWGKKSLKDLCGLTYREELLDPATNLRCGRLLYEVHLDVYGDGWKPW